MSDMSPRVHRVIDRARNGRVAAEFIAVPADTVAALRNDLERAIEGEVRFGAADRALWSTDASNYRQAPYGVILPKSKADAVTTIALCSKYDVPVAPRGGGTSLAGQGCNTAVLIDFSKYMDGVLSLDAEARRAVVEPGCILDTLRDAAEKHHLTFGPDPSTHDHNTLGGMIGNNSCGVHSIMAGRTADNVHALEIITYDGLRMRVGPTSRDEYESILRAGGRRGEIYRAMRDFWDRYGERFEAAYPKIPRRVSGYENLDQLSWDKSFNVARALVGTEATLVTVLEATLDLVHSPPARVLLIVGFPDIFAAADSAGEAVSMGAIGVESIDQLLVDFMHEKHFRVKDIGLLPEGHGWLVCEFGGETADEAIAKAQPLKRGMKASGHAINLVTDKNEQKKVWGVREAALAVTAHVPGTGPTWPGWEDSAVHRDNLGKYLRDLWALFEKYGYKASVYGHFGDALVHCRVNWQLHSELGLENWQSFLGEAADLVVRYKGSISGEHGDGQARGALLERMYGPELMEAQREFKRIWDPRGRMNPGKILDPYPIVSNLRVGPQYNPPEIPGRFAYSPETGSFTKATLRCVGVGACRRHHSDQGVMCPSYMATHEEKHCTRGRARLLFEMLRGDIITDGWKSEAVEESLDLCLACKGCKKDCPVQVDMATYKAEFRSRHYEHRRRPRAAYSMGQIERWAAMASHAPRLANLFLRTPGLSIIAKGVGGLAQSRTVPRFAHETYRSWHRRRESRNAGERVLLWPDTFNNYFRPETAVAATNLLQTLGFAVDIPKQQLCCGRPLYDWGWLDQAKALWRRTLRSLRKDIEDGVTLIGLEPACISAFRDELPALFPGDPLAAKLAKQTRLLSEFLCDRHLAAKLAAPSRAALVQFHCHHHAVMTTEPETSLLKSIGADAQILSAGCCGMAGSFGFESAKYDLSLQIGQRALFPAIRNAPSRTAILADGFSCREQIEQVTGRKTLHLAQYLAAQ
ncbi:MAG TPA: FAD-linked oxidase C-terminal domain-containing protein [Rhizomicrobium sp.]|jgi:FAD/FMN-containing dehydrogenase/Fe-S oxidoreductase|nr:FAD-linked oxidase C-terminal domain-containing protein [Rhizomicrobium sp.]